MGLATTSVQLFAVPVWQFLKNFILPLLDSSDGPVLLGELRPHWVPKRLVFLSHPFHHLLMLAFHRLEELLPRSRKIATPVLGLDPWWHQHAAGCQTTDAARPPHLSSCWTAPSSPRKAGPLFSPSNQEEGGAVASTSRSKSLKWPMTTLSLAHCSICSSVMVVSTSRVVNDISPEEPRKSMIFSASASEMPSTDTSCDLVPRFRDTPSNLAHGLRCIMSQGDDPVAIVARHNIRQCHNHQEKHNSSSASMNGNWDTPNHPCMMYPNNPTWQIPQSVNAHHNKSSAPQEISSANPVTEF